jgi:RNA-directed DNA polymerase
MEEVCERENRKRALKRVKANQGSAGVDGMTVQQLPEHLKQHWPAIREQLLSGTYKPQPVKRVEIPKPDGAVRKLGIPTGVGPVRPAGGHAGTARQLGPDVF